MGLEFKTVWQLSPSYRKLTFSTCHKTSFNEKSIVRKTYALLTSDKPKSTWGGGCSENSSSIIKLILKYSVKIVKIPNNWQQTIIILLWKITFSFSFSPYNLISANVRCSMAYIFEFPFSGNFKKINFIFS